MLIRTSACIEADLSRLVSVALIVLFGDSAATLFKPSVTVFKFIGFLMCVLHATISRGLG